MNDSKNVHIVFISDENYVMPTLVAIESLYKNKKCETSYFVHVIGCNITPESYELFTAMNREKMHVEVMSFLQTQEMLDNKINYLHVSTAALYKFSLGNIFPDYDKILYLDGDILVMQDLSDLYNTELSDYYAAVVKDYKPMTYNPPQPVKLGISHKAYFNSGVMLLNLKKFRDDDLYNKLIDYRTHGINYFMDQDALNVVFKENVIYLPFLYNVMSSVMGYFNDEEIINYYMLPKTYSKSDIYTNATIIHLCTKYKPWLYSNVPFSHEWYLYFMSTPYSIHLEREILDENTRKKIFAELSIERTAKEFGIELPVIVSLTSFPARIQYVHKVINSILLQTVKADKIILWLAKEQFPNLDNDLPLDLLNQTEQKFEIRWCEDIRPHKKYFYVMQEYPESIVITVDDDVYYSEYLIENLLKSYIKFPFAISAMRAHLITFDNLGQIMPYSKWKREYKIAEYPSLALCATGVGGVLYPPHILHKNVFKIDEIKKLCINADDIWLKVMELLTYTPVVVARGSKKIDFIEGTQSTALWRDNDINGANDIQISNILNIYNYFNGKQDSLLGRVFLSSKNIRKKQLNNCSAIEAKLLAANHEIDAIHNSVSYKIGRFITFIPRKFRGCIKCYKEHGFRYTAYRLLVHFHIRKG